ncbi:hypothetical protein CSUI_005656 [Cystoisospora suis]|uniref:Transmembrane protein n=1 Tax=Cystoisospora suis TaxID=483139 RepID=A0A2C6KWU5_9APIC|nr:hypothetical protein CSUI_005656 [Cystoisospora suis]
MHVRKKHCMRSTTASKTRKDVAREQRRSSYLLSQCFIFLKSSPRSSSFLPLLFSPQPRPTFLSFLSLPLQSLFFSSFSFDPFTIQHTERKVFLSLLRTKAPSHISNALSSLFFFFSLSFSCRLFTLVDFSLHSPCKRLISLSFSSFHKEVFLSSPLLLDFSHSSSFGSSSWPSSLSVCLHLLRILRWVFAKRRRKRSRKMQEEESFY